MPLSSTITLAFRIVCLLPALFPVHSLIVQSEHSGGWATGFDFDAEYGQALIVGTTFSSEFWDLTIQGNQDTDCFVLLVEESSNEVIRGAFESPQLCVGGAISVKHEAYGIGVIMGHDSQGASILQTVDYYQNLIHLGFAVPYALPEKTIPVASIADSVNSPDIYVALHNTGGKYLTIPTSGALNALLTYWSEMTHETNTSPSIIKMNAVQGKVEYTHAFTLTSGQATITSLAHSQNSLIVTGKTNGNGPAFGKKLDPNDSSWDGYVAFLDSDSGTVQESFRIAVQANKDDIIQGTCTFGDDLFLVGTTEGRIFGIQEKGVIVIKFSIKNRRMIWKRQIHAAIDDSVQGFYCAVPDDENFEDGDVVYVGGITKYDLTTDFSQTFTPVPSKTQDVFVTAMLRLEGQELWTRQLDTSSKFGENRDDVLAGMKIHPLTNILNVVINSRNTPKQLNDVVLLDLQPDGTNDLIQLDEEQMQEDLDLGNDVSIPSSSTTNDEDTNDKTIIGIAIALPVLFAMIVFGIQIAMHRTDVEETSSPRGRRKNSEGHEKPQNIEEAVEQPPEGQGNRLELL